MGVSWEERDGKATPRLQGPSQYSPPGLVTFCQSLCCVFIDARNQADVRVFLSAPHSRVSTSLEEKSCLPFPEMRSVPWHFTLMLGPLHFPALVADPWKYPIDALAFCVNTTCRAWSSQAALSWPFAFCATTLKYANWNGCNGTLFALFRGTHWSNWAH